MTAGALPGEGRPVLVMGFAVTGVAVVRYLVGLGVPVVVADDRPDAAMRERAGALGILLVEKPGPALLAELAGAAGLVVVSPGIPANHPLFRVGTPVVSELELAGLASVRAGTRLAAITGTNGKTTVTTMVTEILEVSGMRARSAGNIGAPLVEVLQHDPEVAVVEASSFQLALTAEFRPGVAAWLNLSENHLDWHPSMAHYVAAKARIWANQGKGDTAVWNTDDPVVTAQAEQAPAKTHLGFGLHTTPPGGVPGYREEGGWLRAPDGSGIIAVSDLWRALPHDRSNSLAACATATAAGGSVDACRSVLGSFKGVAHRLEMVADVDGVRWFDDSKATTPSSVRAALAGFGSVVLIAGGRNKGLDLGVMAGDAARLRAVIAIGEAAGEVADVFGAGPGSHIPVVRAGSMAEAVDAAGMTALPGDVVLLSPGCASFDWYSSYAERGDDFARLVRRRTGKARRRPGGRPEKAGRR